MLVWIALSGHLDAVHLGFGVASVGFVLALSRIVPGVESASLQKRRPEIHWLAAARYPFWLLKEIVLANLQVARIILHPRLPIDPVLVQFDGRLEDPLAQVVLGNSITLTPGTITLSLERGTYVVHAITREGASATALGGMRGRVAEVFGEASAPIVTAPHVNGAS